MGGKIREIRYRGGGRKGNGEDGWRKGKKGEGKRIDKGKGEGKRIDKGKGEGYGNKIIKGRRNEKEGDRMEREKGDGDWGGDGEQGGMSGREKEEEKGGGKRGTG